MAIYPLNCYRCAVLRLETESLYHRLALACEVLEEMEWAHVSLECERSCPTCCAQETDGHEDGCKLLLAIRRTKER